MRGGIGLMALLCFLARPLPAAAQFAPGPLSRAHAQIDKPTACFECHEPRKATRSERCLQCHVELAARVAAGTGFHGRMAPAERQACGQCHREHGGRDAALVQWQNGRERFDHHLTGWDLEGAHTKPRCDDCHKAKYIRAADVLAKKSVNLARTHLGLSTHCLECHPDVHRGQFQARLDAGECSSCHTQTAWKPSQIDHDKSRFPLRGRHEKVDCVKCHPSENDAGQTVAAGTSQSFARYRPLSFDSCKSCHKDPHRNRYGPDCASCHSVQGWNVIAVGKFNHGLTKFPLRGRHVKVDCAKCHKEDFKKKLPFDRCGHCHRDVHEKQLVQRADQGECASCHTVQGFSPAHFALREHANTRFPLQDAHLAIACDRCHPPLRSGAPAGALRFRFERRDCQVCHKDVHQGQFAAPGGGTDCKRCHGSLEWSISHFDHDRLSRFPLEGAHARAQCASCHRTEKRGSDEVVRYRPLEVACRSCHKDAVTRSQLGR